MKFRKKNIIKTIATVGLLTAITFGVNCQKQKILESNPIVRISTESLPKIVDSNSLSPEAVFKTYMNAIISDNEIIKRKCRTPETYFAFETIKDTTKRNNIARNLKVTKRKIYEEAPYKAFLNEKTAELLGDDNSRYFFVKRGNEWKLDICPTNIESKIRDFVNVTGEIAQNKTIQEFLYSKKNSLELERGINIEDKIVLNKRDNVVYIYTSGLIGRPMFKIIKYSNGMLLYNYGPDDDDDKAKKEYNPKNGLYSDGDIIATFIR